MRRRKKHRGPFWGRWHERQHRQMRRNREARQDEFSDIDPRTAWREHFSDYLGQPPEKHWLFGGRRFKPWASGDWGPPGMFNPFIADLMSKGGGLLPLLVLHLLAEKPRYGNDIMREIEDRTQGHWGSNPGAVYPLLGLMEEVGLVRSQWEDPDKRTRRTYHLTQDGEQELARLKDVMRPKLEEALSVMQSLLDEIGNDGESQEADSPDDEQEENR